jgi:AraC-like DNA-binding protein
MKQVQTKLCPGEAVVVVAGEVATTLCLAVDKGRRKSWRLSPGERLLLAPANETIVKGGAHLMPFDLSRVLRLLAFFEHCNDTRPVIASDTLELAACRSRRPLEQPDMAAAWLINAIATNEPVLARFATIWRKLEVYQLVRHVLSHDASTSVDLLAERYGLSVAHFRRKCRKVFDRPLKQELRILRAARALLYYPESQQSLTRLAEDNGYASPSHFCTEIKSLVGISPRGLFRAVTLA